MVSLRSIAACLALILIACGSQSEDPVVTEWLAVLDVKRSLRESATDDRGAQQRYVDSLAEFIQRNPQHSRARTVYRDLLVDHGDALVAQGHYEPAVTSYLTAQKVLPGDGEISKKIAFARDRGVVTLEELSAIRLDADRDEVTAAIGPPLPGWSTEVTKSDRLYQSWYYRRDDGGVAGVFFLDGKVFAAEHTSRVALQKQPR